MERKVIEGTYRVLSEVERTLAASQDWSALQLNRDEKEILADAAHVLRFGDSEGETTTPIRRSSCLLRSVTMTVPTIWTVWNVVQVNAIRGGLRVLCSDDHWRPRCINSRAVNGIDQDIKGAR